MRRFYCTICKKQKRIRRFPSNCPTENIKVEDRLGTCRFHGRGDGVSRSSINSHKKVGAHLGSTRKLAASSARSKSK